MRSVFSYVALVCVVMMATGCIRVRRVNSTAPQTPSWTAPNLGGDPDAYGPAPCRGPNCPRR